MIANLGLTLLIEISIPVLITIYPPCIVLVLLSFTRQWWRNPRHVITPAVFISLLFGMIDGIKSSVVEWILPAWTAQLPLAEHKMVWVVPAVVMLIVAIIWDRIVACQMISRPR